MLGVPADRLGWAQGASGSQSATAAWMDSILSEWKQDEHVNTQYGIYGSRVDKQATGTKLYLRFVPNLQGSPKNGTVFWYALTSSNINRFSKLFHC